MYQKEIETLPVEELRKLQSERLVKLVNRVYDKVPFYKKQLDAHGVHPRDITSIEDLNKLPFTQKTDLRDQYPFGFLAVPQSDLSRIHCSSGTTGKPTVVAYTKKDLSIFSDVVARSLTAAGAKPGMKMHNAYGYGLFTGGVGIHYGAEKMGMSVIPVSGGMTERQITLLKDFQSEVICCTPSYAQTIAHEIEKQGLDLADFNLKYAVLGAEPWTDAMRKDLEKNLNVKATNIYGLSEVIGPGVSQEALGEENTGCYIWEDHFYPEIVDRHTGKPLPYGEEGVLVFTTLTKEAMPFLRYWTNDICSLTYDHSTSRTHIKMSSIKGRADDMLIIRGVNLFHTQVEEVFSHYDELSAHYQLIVRKKGTMDVVQVVVETTASFQQELLFSTGFTHEDCVKNETLSLLIKKLKKRVKDNTGLSMDVQLKPCGSVHKSTGGKIQRIVDLRHE